MVEIFIYGVISLIAHFTMVIFNFLVDFLDVIFEVIKFDKFSTDIAIDFFLLF